MTPSTTPLNVHRKAMFEALGHLSRADIAILDRASQDLDSDQSVEHQYRHAMRDLDHGQTVEQARALANAYVRERYAEAWSLASAGDRAGSLYQFGLALHTIQDSTSPAHAGFQGWRQAWTDGGWKSSDARAHVEQELTYPGNNSALFRSTQGAYQWYTQRSLPKGDLFQFGHD